MDTNLGIEPKHSQMGETFGGRGMTIGTNAQVII